MDDQLIQAARLLAASKRVAALTGAGVSKESGIPTFRDAQTGIWAQYDPTQLASPQAFAANPKLVWEFYTSRRAMLAGKSPNPGHLALAALQKRLPAFTLITQNVDDLHELAGSTGVIRLHGRLNADKCSTDCQGDPTPIDRAALPPTAEVPPRCPHCASFIRPDVVWFGELLPVHTLEGARDAAMHSEVMLVIGTSGMVMPAADLPVIAKRAGAAIIEVNPERTPLTRLADVWLQGAAGVALPALVAALDAV